MKKLFTFVKPIVRGAIKSIPGGNIITEVIGNIKANNADQAQPHNWKSIITQLVIVGAIVYSFATHLITLDQLIGYLK